jgi:hypothetical protein
VCLQIKEEAARLLLSEGFPTGKSKKSSSIELKGWPPCGRSAPWV